MVSLSSAPRCSGLTPIKVHGKILLRHNTMRNSNITIHRATRAHKLNISLHCCSPRTCALLWRDVIEGYVMAETVARKYCQICGGVVKNADKLKDISFCTYCRRNQERKKSKLHYVYILECEGYHKIGVAADVNRRVNSMESGNPLQINIIFRAGYPSNRISRDIEKSIHKELEEYKHKKEWFILSEEQVEYVKGVLRLELLNHLQENE